MKQGRSFADLTLELERQANAKRDFLASTKRLAVYTNGRSEMEVGEPVSERFGITEIGHQGLADYLQIPLAFYQRLRKEKDELRVSIWSEKHEFDDSNTPVFDVVVNSLLWQKERDSRLVRTLDGNVRAVLSPSYNPDLDNYDVFLMTVRAMQEQGLGPDTIMSAEVTERRLYVKVVSPKLEATIKPSNLHSPHGGHHLLKVPQVVQAGFILTNSEVGLGSLCVRQVVYKLMCTNLWIREEAYRQRHLGKALEAADDGSVYRSDTRAADARARLLKIRDHIADALSEHKFRAFVAQMQEAAEVGLEGSPEKVVELTAKRLCLSEVEEADVMKNLIAGADLSLWGLSNAVTGAAHTAQSYDRSTELEELGARLLTLPVEEARMLVRAA